MDAILGFMRRYRIDPYLVLIVTMMGLATLLPVRGMAADAFDWATKIAIAVLFFFHGAKLSREAVIGGLTHWRLHLSIVVATFLIFPAIGFAARFLPVSILPQQLATGVLFLCCLPSTIQSSIAFVGAARGNVAAAVVAASASNLIGIFITPVLVAVLMHTSGGTGMGLEQVQAIVVQLLLPFIAGQLARRWIGAFVDRHRPLLGYFDRGVILAVVYGSFSAAVNEGIWGQVTAPQIAVLAVLSLVILAAILAVTAFGARALGFSKEDEITIVMCGSKKSLASGAPMAGILFPAASVGLILLPLMLFHQIQLMACAAIAQRYGQREEPAGTA